MTYSIIMRKNKSIVECTPQTNKNQGSLEEVPKKKKIHLGMSVDDCSSSPASKLITKSSKHALADTLAEVKSGFEGNLKEHKKRLKKIRLEHDTDIKREPVLLVEEALTAEKRISEKKLKKDRKMDERKLKKKHPAGMMEPERSCSVEQELTAEEMIVAKRKLKKDRKKKEKKSNKECPTENKEIKSDLSLEEKLTAEERRVFERKLKKERKKEMRKLKQACATNIKEVATQKPSGCELALQYLTSWSQKAEDWKFRKTRQTWLLMHLYDPQKVPGSHFSILLDYLEGLRGSARDLTVRKAEALMKEHENVNPEDETVLELMERARQVIQLLS